MPINRPKTHVNRHLVYAEIVFQGSTFFLKMFAMSPIDSMYG